MRKIALLPILVALLGLAGCNSAKHIEVEPVKVVTSDERLACVTSRLSPSDRGVNFTVVSFDDETGKINTTGSADATGAFNTQGAATMLINTLARTGVDVVDTSTEFRTLAQWQNAQKPGGFGGTAAIASIGIGGGITCTDFNPGSGFDIKVAGVGGGVFSNSVTSCIDMRATTLPSKKGGPASGQVVANATVQAEIKQGGVEVSVSRFVGGATSRYIALEAGSYWRAPLQASTRSMLEFAVADILSQIFKIDGCMPEAEPIETMLAEAQ